ncbi:MAG TPA: hypothetical protein VMG41_03995 [Gemmatimonadales bacterium]|nr:hypothetical protein [Gemmatimonadales bacterium]
MQTPMPMPPGLDPNLVLLRVFPLVATVVVLITCAVGLRWVFRTPVGEAIAQRIREGKRPKSQSSLDTSGAVYALEERVEALQEQVTELAERLDFAERLLAAKGGREVGPGPN